MALGPHAAADLLLQREHRLDARQLGLQRVLLRAGLWHGAARCVLAAVGGVSSMADLISARAPSQAATPTTSLMIGQDKPGVMSGEGLRNGLNAFFTCIPLQE